MSLESDSPKRNFKFVFRILLHSLFLCSNWLPAHSQFIRVKETSKEVGFSEEVETNSIRDSKSWSFHEEDLEDDDLYDAENNYVGGFNESSVEGRFINPLNPFDLFGNPYCQHEGLDGMCYEIVRCLALAGRVGAVCRGFRGICCRFLRECGQRSSQEIIYWSNHNKWEKKKWSIFNGRKGRKHFADPASTCEFKVIKRTRHYCGLRVEPHIYPKGPFDIDPSNPDRPNTQSGFGCNDMKLSVLGLGDRLELTLCSARDSINIKRYDIDITNVDDVKLALSAYKRAETPVDVRIVQLKCSEFVGEDLTGSPTEAIVSVTPSPEEVKPPSPPPVPTVSPSPPAPPVPNFATCGVKSRVKREARSELIDFIKHLQQVYGSNNRNGYPVGPPITNSYNRFDERANNVQWDVPNNNESIFHYFMGDPSLLTTRITYGKETQRNEFPWQVAMFVGGNRFSCGGSIIGDFYILTAAHCVISQQFNPGAVKFHLGDWDLSSSTETSHQEVLASTIHVHPSYSRSNLQNDIAVVKVNRRIEFNEAVRPICLPLSDLELTDHLVTITGWGRDENGRLVSKMHQLSALVMSNDECARRWGGNKFIINTMMCMDSQSGDSCNGDSGGPSVMEVPDGSGKYYQVGIVSFGSGSCTDKNLPGVYTRVTKYRDWIRSQMV